MGENPQGQSVLILGIGNHFCGDDAIGLIAAHRIQELSQTGVTVVEHSGELLRLLDIWDGYSSVIVIDAIAPADTTELPQGVTGRIVRLDLLDDSAFVASAKISHQLDLAQTVRLARQLGRVPSRLVLFGVLAHCMEAGAELSSELQALIEPLAEAVLGEARSMRLPWT